MKAIAERICKGSLVQHAYSANIETDRTTVDEPGLRETSTAPSATALFGGRASAD